MASIFCCSSVTPYKNKRFTHEHKFVPFLKWADYPRVAPSIIETQNDNHKDQEWPYAVQLVRQVNYGPLESTRYFVPEIDIEGNFAEITEKDLIDANFAKLNAYKNFKCDVHGKFFEVNLYEKDPVNLHHWRSNIARPSKEIDLGPSSSS